MLKIALDAGHGLHTPGNEVPEYMGYGQIKEWTLNDRIVTALQDLLNDYDVETLRLDDETGQVDVELDERSSKANQWGADICIINHHNAGIKGGDGGGLVIFRYPNSSLFTQEMQRALYDSIIAQTELSGNRASPLQERSLHMLRRTSMAAVLIEHGFMDSTTDMEVVMQDDFPRRSAEGIVNWLENHYGIEKKSQERAGDLYRVQTGAFRYRHNADALAEALEKLGFDTYIYEDDGLYKVQVGAFAVKSNADAMAERLEMSGFETYITKS